MLSSQGPLSTSAKYSHARGAGLCTECIAWTGFRVERRAWRHCASGAHGCKHVIVTISYQRYLGDRRQRLTQRDTLISKMYRLANVVCPIRL